MKKEATMKLSRATHHDPATEISTGFLCEHEVEKKKRNILPPPVKFAKNKQENQVPRQPKHRRPEYAYTLEKNR